MNPGTWHQAVMQSRLFEFDLDHPAAFGGA
jgi:hypothetical protein